MNFLYFEVFLVITKRPVDKMVIASNEKTAYSSEKVKF